MEGTEEENAAAARIQAIQRGKQARREVEEKRANALAAAEAPAAEVAQEMPEGTDEENTAEAPAGAPEEMPQGTDQEHAAATRIQAIQRGKQARKQVAGRLDGAAGEEAAGEPAASGAEELPQGTEQEHAAATRIQAIQRGKQARKQVEERREGVAGAEASPEGAAEPDQPTAEAAEELPQGSPDEHAAAAKIQAIQRGKQARREVEEKRASMHPASATAPAATEDPATAAATEPPPLEPLVQQPDQQQSAADAEGVTWVAAPRLKRLEAPGGPDGTLAVSEDAGKHSSRKPSNSRSAAGKELQADQLAKVKGLDKQQLCIDLLMVGCVQSFVDFFYITHRKTAPPDSATEQEPTELEIPEQTLVFLKETLETAESAHRAQSYKESFESYGALAEYFEKVPDLRSAMYFHQRCVDVATEVDARDSIAKANLNLGTCEEQGDNWQSARQYHERALDIATSGDSLPLQIRAASRLTHVYQVLAEKCEKESRDTEAIAYYERCLRCAQLSRDSSLEGTACHKLGLAKQKTGDYESAIDLQRQYLDICRMREDSVGESAARAALAHAYEATGSTKEAIRQLESLLGVASEAGELQAQARACLNLGILYNGSGDHDKSVELLEQHFDLARQIGDRRLIDSARVVLGMVRGNGKMQSYIDLVTKDLDQLLKWKSKRQMLDAM